MVATQPAAIVERAEAQQALNQPVASGDLGSSTVTGDFRSAFIDALQGKQPESAALSSGQNTPLTGAPAAERDPGVVSATPAGSAVPQGDARASRRPAGSTPDPESDKSLNSESGSAVTINGKSAPRIIERFFNAVDRNPVVQKTGAAIEVVGSFTAPVGFAASLGAPAVLGLLDGLVGRFAMKAAGAYREAVEFLTGRREDPITRNILDKIGSGDISAVATLLDQHVPNFDSEEMKRIRNLVNSGQLEEARNVAKAALDQYKREHPDRFK